MTTEDTLTAIDATLAGYYDTDVMENAQRLARVLGRSGWSSPARERGTYVENTTSREQEGQ